MGRGLRMADLENNVRPLNILSTGWRPFPNHSPQRGHAAVRARATRSGRTRSEILPSFPQKPGDYHRQVMDIWPESGITIRLARHPKSAMPNTSKKQIEAGLNFFKEDLSCPNRVRSFTIRHTDSRWSGA